MVQWDLVRVKRVTLIVAGFIVQPFYINEEVNFLHKKKQIPNELLYGTQINVPHNSKGCGYV